MSTKTRRSYTEAFKEEAVRLVRESGHPVAQVARDLGIADHLLYRWRAEQQQAEGRGQTRQSLRAEQAELIQLRRENRLAEYGLIPSMSRKGNCWDNACVESFFGTLKRELVYHRHYATRDEAKEEIFEYIEVFYNRQRGHSTLGYHSPAEYEARAAVA